MAQVIITINYREYAISCENGEEVQIMKLGRLLDDKAHSLTQALGPVNENMLLAMTGLLIADELNETKKALAEAQKALSAAPASPSVATNTTATANETQPSPLLTEETLSTLDDKLATHIDSLSATIKSIALKLKSL